MEEGISLVATVGGVYNTWQAPQPCTIRSLAASVLIGQIKLQGAMLNTNVGKNKTIKTVTGDQRCGRNVIIMVG